MVPTRDDADLLDLLDQLSACDRTAVVQLALNPDFPMSHRVGSVAAARDEKGRPVPSRRRRGTRPSGGQ
ncbi:hypothetical protein [Streptomyces sp. Je 1-369]|uniref:hypothetical protein n=1 Tax=Streptomyces sp. Je 1-369 TaxID=2966192 RepID=UPI002285607D|nr:hypothetical protein [Streptomyces sp. Je 1-369]WAL93859.1 hypothetical protein NOO62_04735 [Streptomyces sp. Je 1-369]